MNFDDFGLPPVQMIQDAFTHSQNAVQSTLKEELANFERQITRMFRDSFMMLQIERQQTKMPDDVYKRELAQLQEIRKQQLAAGPRLVGNELDKRFAANNLRPAQELFKSADHAAPEAIAATLLAECVRSPRDFREIEKAFGPVVADILADILHAENYPAERTQIIASISDDAKRAYTAMTIATLEATCDRADLFAKRSAGQRMIFPEGQEEHIFDNFKQVWGIDAKLQERMLEAFNRAAEKLLSKFRMEKDAGGDLQLVPFTPPEPPAKDVKSLPGPAKPKPPGGGGGSIGGDVF